jgi:hypothetical protein
VFLVACCVWDVGVCAFTRGTQVVFSELWNGQTVPTSVSDMHPAFGRIDCHQTAGFHTGMGQARDN